MDPPLVLHHFGDGVLAGEHLAAQVDVHGPLPDLLGQLGDQRVPRQEIRVGQGGVVVEDVETSESIDGGRHRGADVGFDREVGSDPDGDASVVHDALRHPCCLGLVDVDDHHRSPFAGQCAHRGGTDPAGTAGHHGHFVGDSSHYAATLDRTWPAAADAIVIGATRPIKAVGGIGAITTWEPRLWPGVRSAGRSPTWPCWHRPARSLCPHRPRSRCSWARC